MALEVDEKEKSKQLLLRQRGFFMGRVTTRPQKQIDQAVERYLKGEDASSLARQYGVSRAGFYLWVNRAKKNAVNEARAKDIGPQGVAKEAEINVRLENKSLRAENEELRKKLFALLVKHKEL
jgi:transposase